MGLDLLSIFSLSGNAGGNPSAASDGGEPAEGFLAFLEQAGIDSGFLQGAAEAGTGDGADPDATNVPSFFGVPAPASPESGPDQDLPLDLPLHIGLHSAGRSGPASNLPPESAAAAFPRVPTGLQNGPLGVDGVPHEAPVVNSQPAAGNELARLVGKDLPGSPLAGLNRPQTSQSAERPTVLPPFAGATVPDKPAGTPPATAFQALNAVDDGVPDLPPALTVAAPRPQTLSGQNVIPGSPQSSANGLPQNISPVQTLNGTPGQPSASPDPIADTFAEDTVRIVATDRAVAGGAQPATRPETIATTGLPAGVQIARTGLSRDPQLSGAAQPALSDDVVAADGDAEPLLFRNAGAEVGVAGGRKPSALGAPAGPTVTTHNTGPAASIATSVGTFVAPAAQGFAARLEQVGTDPVLTGVDGIDSRPVESAMIKLESAGSLQASQAAPEAATARSLSPAILTAAGAIARNAAKGENRFQVRLDPPELGRVDVRLNIGDDGVARAHLVVERSETLDMFMRDQRQLERALEQAGVKTDENSLQFSLKDGNGGEHDPTKGFARADDGSAVSGVERGDAAEDDPIAETRSGRSHDGHLNITI